MDSFAVSFSFKIEHGVKYILETKRLKITRRIITTFSVILNIGSTSQQTSKRSSHWNKVVIKIYTFQTIFSNSSIVLLFYSILLIKIKFFNATLLLGVTYVMCTTRTYSFTILLINLKYLTTFPNFEGVKRNEIYFISINIFLNEIMCLNVAQNISKLPKRIEMFRFKLKSEETYTFKQRRQLVFQLSECIG